MSKKIIAAAFVLLALVVAFAACKKEDEYTTKPIGGVDVTVDKNGDMFVTNPDGDRIPVTTSEDGFYDDIHTLLTETTSPVKDEKPSKGGNTTTTTTTTTTTNPGKDPTKPSDSTTSTTHKPIEIVGGGKAPDTISRDEIRNPKK